MGWFRFAWSVAVLALALLLAPGLFASARAQDDPRTSTTQAQVDPTTVEAEVRSLFYLMRGINNDLAEMFTSGPAFFCKPPGSPSKAEASAQLDAIQLRIDAAKARSANLKAQIAVLERNHNNLHLYKNWDPTNAKRFDNLDRAERGMPGEMNAARARLAKIPERPCGKRTDPPPTDGGVERVPGGGGAPPPPPPTYDPAIDERQVPGLPGGKPNYRDLQAIALPDFFCSYQDRSSFLWGTFWPWHDATAKEVGEAYNYAARLEAHASQLRRAGNDAAAEATKRLADHASVRAKAWGKTWEKVFDDAYKRFEAIKVVPCDEAKKPLTTPQPPLPPGYFDTPHRPSLETGLRIPTPPKSFCTAEEKHHYLMHVYFPLANKANENARLAAAHMHDLSVRLQKALAEFGPDSAQYRTLRVEHQAYAAIRTAAIDFADQVTGPFRASVEAIPIVDCHPPVPGREITTPQPPLPPLPPQLPPSLNRPQFERWEMPKPPKSFCSETERVAFLNTVYTPASTRALANAERSAAYRAQLNKAFTETMRNDGGPVWAAVQAEIKAWTPIDDDARAKAEAVRALYATIMAVPIVDCDPPKKTIEIGGGGKPAPPPSPLYKTLPDLSLPDCFKTQAELDAFLRKIAQARALNSENFKAAMDYGKALEAYIEGRKAAKDEEGVKLGRDIQESFGQGFINRMLLESQRLDTIGDRARLVPACPPAEPGRLIEIGGPQPFTRPLMGSVHLAPPPRFCSEAERQKYLDAAYDALDVVEDNMDALDDYDDYLDKRRAEPLSAEAFRRGVEQEWIDSNYDALDAVGGQIEDLIDAAKAAPIDCPKDRTVDPEKPCPPSRNPISVGSNAQVGSGARTREKVASTAMGLVGGLIGGGGGGGGGGGSDGPQLLSCKIKDKDMTLFDDPATGVSLGVAAREGKNGLTVFAKVMKSPDSGTFQAAFLENGAGDQQAPSDVGICGLWGEWKLTVSWTKSTYVDGQLVKREHGGWSKGGTFSIPGVVSSAGRPDGLWRRLGFSNASHGARQIAMTYKATPEDFAAGPVGMVLHVTRPAGNPVTTVPFVLQMTRGPGGIVFERAQKTPCEKGQAMQVGAAGGGPAMC